MTWGHRQGRREAVQTEPSFRGEPDDILIDYGPSGVHPWGDHLPGSRKQSQAAHSSQAEVYLLGSPVRLIQNLRATHRIPTLGQGSNPVRIGRNVPAASRTIKSVRGGAECCVGDVLPVGGVVSGAVARQREVGHLVVFEPCTGHRLM